MNNKILIILIFLISNTNSYAQFDNNIDSIKYEIKIETDSIKIAEMYTILARLHRSNNIKLAEKYAEKSLEISERNNYPIGIAKAKLEMVDLFEFLKPEFSYNLALSAHSIFSEEKDSMLMIRSLNSLANVVYIQEDYDKSYDIYSEAYKFALKLNDTEMIPTLLNNMAICYASKEEYLKAKKLFTKALESDSVNNIDISLVILGNLGEVNSKLNIMDSVLIYFNQVKQICNKINNKKELAWIYNNYSSYYQSINKLDSAEHYARKGLAVSKTVKALSHEHTSYINLRSIFTLKENKDSIIRYYGLESYIKDSISRIDKLRSIDLLTIKADLEKNMLIKELTNKQLKNSLYASILLILLIIISIIFLFQAYKNRKKKMIFEKEKISLEKELIEEKLLAKNMETTAHILNIVSKNELINSIIQQLNTERSTFKKINQQKIQNIINELRLNLNPEIWKEFEIRFKEVQPQYYDNLLQTHPSLTPNELRLCAFLKLNLASKEIAIITQQDVRTIEKGRSRLRKKIGINNQDITLSSYLSKF